MRKIIFTKDHIYGVDVDGYGYFIYIGAVASRATLETIPTIVTDDDDDYAVVIEKITLDFRKGEGKMCDIGVDYLTADLEEQLGLEFAGEELYAEIGIDFNKYPGYVSEIAELKENGYSEEDIDKYVEEEYSNIEQEFDLFVALPNLKRQIIEQAKKRGIPSEALEFP
jgi:hypothetical protein